MYEEINYFHGNEATSKPQLAITSKSVGARFAVTFLVSFFDQ